MLTWRYGRKWQLLVYAIAALFYSMMNVGVAYCLTILIQAASAQFVNFLRCLRSKLARDVLEGRDHTPSQFEY